MCRLLFVQAAKPFDIGHHLGKFAGIAQSSREYQGHGWGCAYVRNDEWTLHKNLTPIWKDAVKGFGSTTRLIAHARSAFQNQGIAVENNMPFYNDRYMFIFNGELHGVRITASGRTGAEKILNYLCRFDGEDPLLGFKKGVDIIRRRSRYVRAMNMILANKSQAYVVSFFNEAPEYFTLHYKRTDEEQIICSDPYPEESGWQAINNETVEEF